MKKNYRYIWIQFTIVKEIEPLIFFLAEEPSVRCDRILTVQISSTQLIRMAFLQFIIDAKCSINCVFKCEDEHEFSFLHLTTFMAIFKFEVQNLCTFVFEKTFTNEVVFLLLWLVFT